MSKILAAMIAGLFAVGAYAQTPSEEIKVQTESKPQQRAETRKDAKAAGHVAQAAGDTGRSTEASGAVTDKANVAGEARRSTRDQRRPNRRKSTQGGTPQ
ncbi:MAG: hypothetical protein JWQ03_278 [Variovorax sp.]|nr:hypothetical protein [Variovorax sp.]